MYGIVSDCKHGLWMIVSLLLAAGCTSQDCVVPVAPAHGRLVPFEYDCPESQANSAACRSVPGTKVPEGWFLSLQCQEGFVLDNDEHGHSQTTCADGRWLPALPSCICAVLSYRTPGYEPLHQIQQPFPCQATLDEATDNITNHRYKCIAPPYPQNGRYNPLPIECALSNKSAESLLAPGTFLPPACVLLYSCNEGYELADDDVISICDKGQWIPKVVECRGPNKVVTRTKPLLESSVKGCELPTQQHNMRFCSFQCRECDCMYSPGATVKDHVVKVTCGPGYRLADNLGFSVVACINGSWSSEFPRCQKLCPPLESDSVYTHCQYGTSQVNCNSPMLPTTTAVYQCKPSHSEYPSLTLAGVYKRTITCKHNGKWSNVLPECEPACGVSKAGVVVSPTIVDGVDTPLGAFPWHTGLYRRNGTSWACICGGSLITNRIVLSAAHCVVLFSPSDLRVAMGKYYRSWDSEEPSAVRRNVSRIKVPAEYNGASTTYAWDIALLLLSEKVQVNSFVMPVCRDIHYALKPSQNSTGYVVGWGKTMENGKESEVLLHNYLTIIDYQVCLRKRPTTLAFDKFCGSRGSASVAEKGDSGGGVTTVLNDLHFIIGIVSVKIDKLSVFTNVSWVTHKRWLDNEIINFDKDINLAEK